MRRHTGITQRDAVLISELSRAQRRRRPELLRINGAMYRLRACPFALPFRSAPNAGPVDIGMPIGQRDELLCGSAGASLHRLCGRLCEACHRLGEAV